MNYYPFHIGDYASATRHLSWEEDAAFRRLLDVYYTHEKPLPAELRAVCRLVLATTETQRQAVETVLGEFFELTECGWVNRRADQEISAMREKQQKQRDKANKRWHKPAEEHGNASAMPRHEEGDAVASEIDANAMPPTPTPTPTPKEGYVQADPGQPVPPKTPRKKSEPPVTDGTWKAYSGAYIAKYGAPPVRNERVNALLAKLVKRLGAEKAPAVAEFFVSKAKNDYYAARMHTVDVLLADAEKLHTEWATGRGSQPKRDIFAGAL